MAVLSHLLAAAALALGTVQAQQNPTCGARYIYEGYLSTGFFLDKSGNQVAKAYSFNSKKQLLYDKSAKHPHIRAQFKVCTPNYQGAPNGEYDQLLYGRIDLPDTKDCLAVTNPGGGAPYYLARATCPNSSKGEQYTTKGIPFNFIMNQTAGGDIRWIGGSIPSKGVYQGPNPPASYCQGEYFVNATNLQHGYNYDGYGEPNTSASDGYRVRLYCNKKKDGSGTGFSTLNLVGMAVISDP
ncbi:hypothetical protein RhiJN_10154 [Ceratobasidium sp. AG-Ba]|nr:hypothetical protein RhiJN_10154 [Ceratobasidium sp. AG-Ba]QRW10908.1 hypothetical protein RhiLY_09907 [Ceratobasidium sp. AG-Ba]